MFKKFNMKRVFQGDMILTFNNDVYHVIDSKIASKAGKQFRIADIEAEIKMIKSAGKTIANRNSKGEDLYEC